MIDGPPDRTAYGPRALLGFLTANTALAGAVMLYMGWVYTNAWLGHFHVNPLDLDIGVTEYALRGLSLFSPALILIGVLAVLVIGIGVLPPPRAGARGRKVLRHAGTAITIAGLSAYLLSGTVDVPTDAVLALLGAGPLMVARTSPTVERSRYAYSLAVVIAVLCGLWAASLYASAKGTEAGRQTARELSGRTAAVVYSTGRLWLSGPGIQVESLPKNGVFRFRYTGLRLLIARGDRYYLLPVDWARKVNATYVLRDGDGLRVELYSGTG